MRHLSITTRWMLALVVVVAIGVAYFMRNKSRGDDGSAATAELAESVVEPPQPRAQPLGDDTAFERVEAEAERVAVPEPELESGLPKPRPGTGKVWKGKVEFVGLGREFGTTLEEVDLGVNRLTLGFECFGRTFPEVVELSFDTFEFVVPYADEDIEQIRVLRASAQGGHWLPAAGFETLAPNFDAPVVVRLQRAPPTRLIVVDARLGTQLDGFKLSSSSPTAEEAWSMTFGKGPISIDVLPVKAGPDGLLRLRVSAEGRVARSIELDLDAGGTHEIRMHRGGSVQVRWTVPDELRPVLWPRTDRPALYVQLEPTRIAEPLSSIPFDGPGARPLRVLADLPKSNDSLPSSVTATIHGAAPGEYRAVLQVSGSGFTRTREVAAATVLVRSGETTEVELSVLPKLDFPAPEWTLDVVVPQEYGVVERLHLLVQRQKPDAELRSTNWWRNLGVREIEPRLWRSAALRADPGTYLVALSIDRTCAARVELNGSPQSPIRVELPAPRSYRVGLRSRGSELPPLPRSLYWRPSPSTENRRGERVTESEGIYEILASGQAIEVALPLPGSMRLAEGEWVRIEGGGEHMLDVVPGPCIRVVLHETNGQPFDTPRSFTLVRATGPVGRSHPLDTRRVQASPDAVHEMLVWFREAGEHELKLGEISGFEPLAPLKLTVSEGPERIVHIDLVRKR